MRGPLFLGHGPQADCGAGRPGRSIGFRTMIAPTMKALIRKLAADRRGAVSTEYLVLVGTVALGLAAALFALGPGLVASYVQTRSIIASP